MLRRILAWAAGYLRPLHWLVGARRTVEFTDRYQALGIPYPNKETVCLGQCEGVGWLPVRADDEDERFRRLWAEAEATKPTDDGYHFIKCPDCDGTGKRPNAGANPLRREREDV